MAAEPDRTPPNQVADDDAVLMPFADRDFIDADHARRRRSRSTQLFPHVLLLEFLDGVSIEVQFLGHLLNRGLAATPTDIEGEPLGIERIVGEPVEAFVLHAGTLRAEVPPECEGEVDPFVAAREIADAPGTKPGKR